MNEHWFEWFHHASRLHWHHNKWWSNFLSSTAGRSNALWQKEKNEWVCACHRCYCAALFPLWPLNPTTLGQRERARCPRTSSTCQKWKSVTLKQQQQTHSFTYIKECILVIARVTAKYQLQLGSSAQLIALLGEVLRCTSATCADPRGY